MLCPQMTWSGEELRLNWRAFFTHSSQRPQTHSFSLGFECKIKCRAYDHLLL